MAADTLTLIKFAYITGDSAYSDKRGDALIMRSPDRRSGTMLADQLLTLCTRRCFVADGPDPPD